MVFDDFLGNIKTQTGTALGLLGCEIRIENLVQLACRNTGSVIFHAKVDIKILLNAGDGDNTALVRTRLNGIDDHILNSAIQLQDISHENTWVLTNRHAKSYSFLIGDRCKAFEDFPQRSGNGNWLWRRSFNVAVALPHGQQLPAGAHMLLDDF